MPASYGGQEATAVLHSWESTAAVLEYWKWTAAALHLRQELTTTQSNYRLRFAVEAETLAIEEQRTEPVLVEAPVSTALPRRRAGVLRDIGPL